jgi:hypothetical protein
MNKPTQEEPFNYLGCIIGLFIFFCWIMIIYYAIEICVIMFNR